MKTSSRNVFYALIATLLFSACSRPYATYQKMPVEHFTSQKSKAAPTVPVETVAPEVATADVKPEAAPAPSLSQAVAVSTPAAELTKAQEAIDQVVASTDNKVTGNKLQKRMARIKTMLSAETTQSVQGAEQTKVTRKSNLAERLMLKNVDKKIKRALAPQNPNAPKAVNIVVTIGALVALIGLILVLATASDAIGLTLLIAGLILLLVGLIV